MICIRLVLNIFPYSLRYVILMDGFATLQVTMSRHEPLSILQFVLQRDEMLIIEGARPESRLSDSCPQSLSP